MRHFYILAISLFISFPGFSQVKSTDGVEGATPSTRMEAFETDKGWGYDIYLNEKKYIHQTTIPSVPGTAGFSSKKDAEKVGNLVLDKINRNEMPPSVTPEELKKLKINVRSQPPSNN